MMIFSSDLSKFFLHTWFMGFLFESGAVVWKKESLNSEHSSFSTMACDIWSDSTGWQQVSGTYLW